MLCLPEPPIYEQHLLTYSLTHVAEKMVTRQILFLTLKKKNFRGNNFRLGQVGLKKKEKEKKKTKVTH
jgi:hypothetical protein